MGTPSYTIERHPTLPVVILSSFESWNMSRDLPPAIDGVRQILDAANTPLFFVIDSLRQPAVNLPDVIMATNYTARLETPIFRHPNMRELLMVSQLKIVELAMKGLQSDVFGNIKVKTFQTLDEALVYAEVSG
jgi:hypothetical protein